jgi:Ca-activated chloride channel family protein
LEIGNSIAVYLIWITAGAALLFVYESILTKRALSRFASEGILWKVVRGYSYRRRLLKRILVVSCLTLLVVAWGMPRVGTGTRIVKREGADIVVALDVSLSMYAEDLKPSRMEVAKRAVRTLISRLQNDRFGLVGFAGSAFINCPLTLDGSALAMFVDFLNPGVVSEQGTDIGRAIATSLDALKSSSGRGKAIVLLTDGEDHGGGIEAAVKRAEAEGVTVYTLGVGTQGGEPIPIKDQTGNVSSYKRDNKDNVVVSRLDVSALREIANATDGETFILSKGDREITRLAKSIQSIERGILEQRSYQDYAEMFQFPLAACLLLLVLEGFIGDRKRNL